MLKSVIKALASIMTSAAICLNITAPAVHGWFCLYNTIPASMKAQIRTSYFERGSGTSDDPFVIARPVQLYNLAWLQDMGELNINGHQFYFTIDTKNDGSAPDVNMTGWTLPPIGTEKYPFIGNFNGNGYTVENLKTANNGFEVPVTNIKPDPTVIGDSTESNVNPQIVGFFGVIGSMNSNGTVQGRNDEYFTYNTAVNEITDIILKSTTVSSVNPKDNQTLVGIVAGYVNGKVEDVGVVSPKMIISKGTEKLSNSGISKLSDYSIIGYCADSEYIDNVDMVKVDIENPEIVTLDNPYTAGNSDEWGGSIPMSDIYTRVKKVYNSADENRNYVYEQSQNDYYDKANQKTKSDITKENTATVKIKRYGTSAGSFVFNKSSKSSDNEQYYYISGGTRVNATDYRYYDADAYIFSDGSCYLNINENNRITSNSSEGKEFIFKNGNLYYIAVDPSSPESATKYYLNCDSNGTLSVDTTANTYWTINDNKVDNKVTCSSGSLMCINGIEGGWCVCKPESIQYIFNDSGYLSCGSSEAVEQGKASQWIVSNDNKLYTMDDQKFKYLGFDDNYRLTTYDTSSKACQWELADYQIYYSGFPVVCSSKNIWTVEVSEKTVYITDGIYYLNIDEDSLSVKNSDTVIKTKWTISSDYKSIYTAIGDNTYYLCPDSTSLKITTNKFEGWKYDGSSFTYNSYYLNILNGVWQLSKDELKDGFYIHDDKDHYLNASGSSFSLNLSYPETVWYQEGNHIFYYDNDIPYYISISSSGWIIKNYTLELTTSATNACTQNGTDESFILSGNKKFLYNNGSKWQAGDSSTNLTKVMLLTQLSLKTASEVVSAQTSPVSSETCTYKTTSLDYPRNESSLYIDYSGENVSYFPLNLNENGLEKDDYSAGKTNTGYIIGGSYDKTTSGTFPYKSGDIRISRYEQSDVKNSLNNKILNETEVYTINNSGTKSLSSLTSSLQKYPEARINFEKTLAKDNYLYGLHFMKGNISADSTFTAHHISINNTEYENYDFPTDCIDFKLKSKGYINFFGGTYFSNNNSFFSLHQIYREGTKIIAIKEITDIFEYDAKDSSKYKYVYKYSDGSFRYSDSDVDDVMNSLPNGYKTTPVFETKWIKLQSNNFKTNRIYYFEIPTDEGEYALGSVEGGTGAYLLYLDISANGSKPITITTEEFIAETTYSARTPKGVQFICDGYNGSINNRDSASFAIPPQTELNGTDSNYFSRDNNSNILAQSEISEATYIGDGISVSSRPDNKLSAIPPDAEIKFTLRRTQIVFHREYTTNRYQKTITTLTAVQKNGAASSVTVKTEYAEYNAGDTPSYTDVTSNTTSYPPLLQPSALNEKITEYNNKSGMMLNKTSYRFTKPEPNTSITLDHRMSDPDITDNKDGSYSVDQSFDYNIAISSADEINVYVTDIFSTENDVIHNVKLNDDSVVINNNKPYEKLINAS